MKKSCAVAARVLSLSIAVAGLSSSARAISSDQAAAILTFPHLVADAANGVDTFLQLANADSSDAVDLLCFLENTNHRCSGSAAVCAGASDCPLGELCVPQWQSIDFSLRLTAGQPFGWRASIGAVLPLPQNLGAAIPPLPEDPFRGLLRCVVVDGSGAPVDRNVLKGTATVERYQSGAAPDAARYNPVGLRAISGANNGDNELILGGPMAEYEGCPGTVLANHFFDHAVDPLTHASELFTDLTLVACSADYFFQNPSGAVVQYVVYNEFEQHFATSRTLTARHSGQLSLVDTNDPTRSIFSAGVSGTLTGQTRITPFGAGIAGIAVERHQALGQPAGTSASAAFNLHSQGEHAQADVLLVGEPPPCRVAPATGCRSAGRTSLLLRDRASANGDKLAWRLRAMQATSQAEFGDPTADTDYGLCLYDGSTGALLAAAHVSPSAASWGVLSDGYRYSDSAAAQDGITRITLRGSPNDRARVLVDGEGANLTVPTLPLQLPVKVQLVNDAGVCWEAQYGAGDVIRNEPKRFKARN